MRTNSFALGGINLLASLFAAMIIGSASSPAGAATLTNTWTNDPPLNVWSDQRFVIPQFNPATGTLQRLEVTVAMRTDGTVRFSSQCTQSKTVNYNYTNTFRLSGADVNMVAGTRSLGGLLLSPGQTMQLGSQASRRTATEQLFEPKIQTFIGVGTVEFTMRREQNLLATCVEGGCGCISGSIVGFNVGVDVDVVYVFEPLPVLAVEYNLTESSVLLRWDQTPGFIYTLENSENFSGWLPILTNVNLPPIGQAIFPIQGASRQFFRLTRSATGSP